MSNKLSTLITPLSETQFENFIIAAGKNTNVMAIKIIISGLNKGKNIEEIIFNKENIDSQKDNAKSSNYTIKINLISPNLFTIYLGCFPSPLAGDAGEWNVEFNNESEVISITQKRFIIS